MNVPTLIVLLLVAAATAFALWLPRRHGRKLTDCSCGCSTPSRNTCAGCQGCPLSDHCRNH